jgi:RNA polymerase-binding protein DksA
MQPEKLNYHRERLRMLRTRLRNEINGLIEAIPQTVAAVGDVSNSPTHLADMASEGLDAEIVLVHNEENIYQAVETAIQKTDGGTFGQCEECGQEISEARLEAIPYTPVCIRCAQKLESRRR